MIVLSALVGAAGVDAPALDPAIHAWARLWIALLWIGVGLFAALSVYVIIAGFFDVQAMFRDLRAAPDDERDPG